jgi:hypothetical protein
VKIKNREFFTGKLFNPGLTVLSVISKRVITQHTGKEKILPALV